MWVRSAVLFVLVAGVAGCVTPTAHQRLAAAQRDSRQCVAHSWLAPPALPEVKRHGHVRNEQAGLNDTPGYAYRVPPSHPDLEQIILRCQ